MPTAPSKATTTTTESAPKRDKSGSYVRDERQARRVEGMIGVGVGLVSVARIEGLDPKTLVRLYGEEMELAVAKVNGQVATALLKKAIGGDVKAQIFWMRSRAGWYCAPAPGDREDEPLGKKAQAAAAAVDAELGTSWEGLLASPAMGPPQ